MQHVLRRGEATIFRKVTKTVNDEWVFILEPRQHALLATLFAKSAVGCQKS